VKHHPGIFLDALERDQPVNDHFILRDEMPADIGEISVNLFKRFFDVASIFVKNGSFPNRISYHARLGATLLAFNGRAEWFGMKV
jgi:hypothetical protein